MGHIFLKKASWFGRIVNGTIAELCLKFWVSAGNSSARAGGVSRVARRPACSPGCLDLASLY